MRYSSVVLEKTFSGGEQVEQPSDSRMNLGGETKINWLFFISKNSPPSVVNI